MGGGGGGGGCKKLTELHSDPDFESGLSITQPYVYASRHSTSNRHAHTSACTLRRLCHEPARVIRQQASPQGITGVEDTSGLFSSEAIHSQHHHIGKPQAHSYLVSYIGSRAYQRFQTCSSFTLPTRTMSSEIPTSEAQAAVPLATFLADLRARGQAVPENLQLPVADPQPAAKSAAGTESGDQPALADLPASEDTPAQTGGTGLSDNTAFKKAHKVLHKAQSELARLYAAKGLPVPTALRTPIRPVSNVAASPARSQTTRGSGVSRLPRGTGSGKPSPVSTTSPPLRSVRPFDTGKGPSQARRGLSFSSSLSRERAPRTFRQVSQDLPYSLLTAEPAGLTEAGYTSYDEAIGDLQTYTALANMQDENAHALSPKLRSAGLLPQKTSPLDVFGAPPLVRKSTTPAAGPSASLASGLLRTGPSDPASGEEGALDEEDLNP